MHRLAALFFVVLALTVAICSAQVNYSPVWGKRNVNGQGSFPGSNCTPLMEDVLSIYKMIRISNGESKSLQNNMMPNPNSSQNVLKARRGVIRMLIIVVLTFALCNLPLHARKMWQYWSKQYKGDTNFMALFTPLTFLVTYFNSGVNPLLYAFLSRNFRRYMKQLLKH